MSQALPSLLPLTIHRVRYLLVPTAGPWVAYFDNHVAGTDGMVTSYLARRLGCRGLRVVAIDAERERRRPHGRRYAATMFELYEPFETQWLNYARTICAADDDGWVFETSGEPQPFEEPENYAKPRIQDRFTPEMLDRYLRALGVRAFDDDFYLPAGTTAALIENRYWRWRKRERSFTLEGAFTRFKK